MLKFPWLKSLADRRPERKQVGWTIDRLERREMLAADLGAAVHAAPDPAGGAEVPTLIAKSCSVPETSLIAENVQQSSDQSSIVEQRVIVFVDAKIDELSALQDAIPADAEWILLNDTDDLVDQIDRHLVGQRSIAAVHLFSHGRDGQLLLGGGAMNQEVLQQRAETIRGWRSAMGPGADWLIYGCEVAATTNGRQFIQSLSELLDVDAAASTDRTGNTTSLALADWDLEYRVGQIDSSSLELFRLETLQTIPIQLGIEVRAAGQTGQEQLELQVDGIGVAIWSLTGTDADREQYQTFYYDADNISADRISVYFFNDGITEDGKDKNLRVDFLNIDGVRHETEHPSVFSNGTWQSGMGVVPGYLQTEYLTNNGVFVYSSVGGSEENASRTRIQIDAMGETGDESMQLIVDGQVMHTYVNVPTEGYSYTYDYFGDVTAEQIQIAFVTSIYDPVNDYDQNLRIDRIRINGTVFESESSATYSTGTYVEGQGIVAGHWQTEVLHADGYFQYAGHQPSEGETVPGGTNEDTGSFSLITSEVTVVEGDRQIELVVHRIGGTQSAASVDWFTIGDTADGRNDYIEANGKLLFGIGESSKRISISLKEDAFQETSEQFAVRLVNPIGANLLAPRTAQITILDNDSNIPTYEDFADATNLTLNGSASIYGNELQLTSAARRQAGTAFYNNAIAIDNTTSFQTSFSFQIGGGVGRGGADGFAFLLQNSSRGTRALGRAGGALGYDTIERSLAIEFDTYLNHPGPGGDKLEVTLNGDRAHPILTTSALLDLNAGRTLYAWVDYNGAFDSLAVYISDTAQKPGFAALQTNINLESVVGSSAYIGFSAGNYDIPNYHRIKSWSFSFDTPDPNPPLNPTGNLSKKDLVVGLTEPLAVQFSPDGRNIYIAEKGGVIKVARDGSDSPSVVLDISRQVNNKQDRGLIDFVLDPQFGRNGYLYVSYTYDPPEVYQNVGHPLAGPDGGGNRAGRISRFTLDPSTGYTRAIEGSELVLVGRNSTWENFNAFTDSTVNLSEPQAGFVPGVGYITDFINSDSRSHTVGGLEFDNDGRLLVGIGDGSSFNQTDRRALTSQSLGSFKGKILRIDPATGQGFEDNPFFDGDLNSNQSRIYQYGLRNPWRLAFDSQNSQLLIGDTGLSSFEEINVGSAGTNFGWPYFEGGQGYNSPTPGYKDLPEAKNFYKNPYAKPASLVLAHQGGSNVVVIGDVTHNLDLGVQYNGDLFYNDMFRGIVRHADIGPDGQVGAVGTFTTDAQFVVDIQQGADNSLYYVNLVEGTVGKWYVS